MISVIMPVYNEAEYLAATIESILGQTYRDYEFIIIDDGSIDTTRQILEDYVRTDTRIKLIVNDGNIGQARSLNRAIIEAKGRYIAVKDSGDLAHPELLARQIKLLDAEEDIYILGSRGYWMDEDGQIISRWDVPSRVGGNELYDGCSLIHSSVMFRKGLFDKIGLYRSSNAEDFDLYARAIQKHLSIANVPEYLINVRKRYGGKQFCRLRQQRISISNIKLRYLLYFLNAHNFYHTLRSLISCLLPLKVLHVLAERWIARGTTIKDI